MKASEFLCSLFFLGCTALHAADKIQFNRDVRPILSDKCFFCHGTDANHRKGDLRLDQKDSACKPAKSGEIAVVPGQPEKSALMARITLAADDDDAMPPKKSEKSLTSQEKAILKQWISEGAEYQGHWAFIPPVRPALPKLSTEHSALSTSPLDDFITARLEKEGLSLSAEADRATLIRRVSLDLTGIPPTPEEVSAFENDHSPAAYARVVDRLLRSSHYGERMAMPWLDSARYADSHGFQTDSSRSQWPWRDWVINAFNANMPFDEFTIEQLAGDLLPHATRDQIVATGFNRNHRLNGEGGIIDEEWRIENVIDRAETTGMTWLALTFNCCRCHDHKFDPITQKDFYSFFAFFNNLPESGTIQGASNRSGGNSQPVVAVPNQAQEQKFAKLDAAVKTAQTRVNEAQKQLPQLLAAWEPRAQDTLKQMTSAWSVLAPAKVKSKGGATLTRQADGSYLASGTNPPKDVYVFDAPMPAAGATAFLLECLADPSLPAGGAGRYINSNFALSDFDVFVQKPGGKPEPMKLAKAEADYSQKGYEIKNLIGGGRHGSWAVDGPTKKENRRAMFVLQSPVTSEQGSMLLLRLRHEAISGHNIGRFRLSSSSLPAKLVKLSGKAFSPGLKAALNIPLAQRTAAQKSELSQFFRTAVESPLRQADDALAAARNAYETFDNSLPNVMVMKEMDQPRNAFVLNRGEYDKPKDKVTAALPASLPPMPAGAPMNRLGLAKWIVSGEHPLTARVWVNRQWEKFFGTGLVKTVENFGMQAEYPSHPELLDWLATEFVRVKWDMKAMQKLIVMSASYRQSSVMKPGAAGLEKDPENRLLWHGPRIRLSGEVVRDQVLALSGLLADHVGGPSVRPYMPDGVWDETSKYGDLRGYKNDTGDALYRRTMYTIWKRTAAPPTMLLFDSPTREICTVKRSRTDTPLQALAMLNEVTFVEAARALAEKMILNGGKSPGERIAWAFRRVTSRDAAPEEMQGLVAGLSRRHSKFNADPESAQKIVRFGEKKPDARVNVAELAAYTMTANVLLNLDEVVTRQ